MKIIMNVLDNYKPELLNLGDLYEIDDDTYYCKFNYNNMPFMIKTNKICVFKKIKKNKDNYVNISITSTDYLLWFETFYKWCIETFCERSEEWFDEPLTLSDVEFSFINPLKSNIKDHCFDIQCTTNEERLHIVDTKDNVNSLESLKDCSIIPTFHIKGIHVNNKYFSLDIEVNNMLVVLEDSDGDIDGNTHVNDDNKEHVEPPTNKNSIVSESISEHSNTSEVKVPEVKVPEVKHESVYLENENKNELNELNEVSIPTDNLEEMNMDIESNGFYEIYELLDEKIKDSIIQNLQKIFNNKKIKLNIDITDIFDEDE
jgi:hypothetical protein